MVKVKSAAWINFSSVAAQSWRPLHARGKARELICLDVTSESDPYVVAEPWIC